jgi:hypothetical protein
MPKTQDHAKDQAKLKLEHITEMVRALERADSDGAREEAEQTIHEDPLSVEVRSPWYTPGSEPGEPEEFMILLCTGGPACRIIGKLDQHGEPETARIEYQDWGIPWTEYRLNRDKEKTVLTYCRQFYFG